MPALCCSCGAPSNGSKTIEVSCVTSRRTDGNVTTTTTSKVKFPLCESCGNAIVTTEWLRFAMAVPGALLATAFYLLTATVAQRGGWIVLAMIGASIGYGTGKRFWRLFPRTREIVERAERTETAVSMSYRGSIGLAVDPKLARLLAPGEYTFSFADHDFGNWFAQANQ